MSQTNLVQSGPRPFENTHLGIRSPLKPTKNSLIVNNLAAHVPIVLKFGILVWYIIPLTAFSVKTKMAVSGSMCKITSVFNPLALSQLSLVRYAKSETAALLLVNVLCHPQIWISLIDAPLS